MVPRGKRQTKVLIGLAMRSVVGIARSARAFATIGTRYELIRRHILRP